MADTGWVIRCHGKNVGALRAGLAATAAEALKRWDRMRAIHVPPVADCTAHPL